MKNLISKHIAITDPKIEGVVVDSTVPEMIFSNPAYCRFAGYSLEEVLDINPSILKPGKLEMIY